MDKETTKMIPGDELHLTMLMAPYSLNLVTGQDRQHLLAYGRAAFDAGKNTGQATPCLNQIAEPVTAGAAVRAFRDYLGVHDGIKLGGQAMDDMALDLARIALDFKHLVESQHPDEAAVDALAALMKAKLAEKRAKGYGGWNDKTQCPQQRLSDMLRAHVDKGDPVDVANFCAMLSARGEGIAAAQQAVQAAVPNPITVSAMRDDGGEQPAYCVMAAYRTETDARAAMSLLDGTAHPAEGVPAQASKWDGKLPERLQSVLNALRLELPAAVVNDVEFEVRSHYEAMHTSLSTSRRMYGAARDRLEAIDAAQPDPFAATQPAAQGIDGREFPPLTPELASILGLMCFQCISFAQALRAAGHTIKTRAEDEQAAVLHWMLGHYFRHGDDWRTAAAEDMKRMEAEALAAQPKQGGDHG